MKYKIDKSLICLLFVFLLPTVIGNNNSPAVDPLIKSNLNDADKPIIQSSSSNYEPTSFEADLDYNPPNNWVCVPEPNGHIYIVPNKGSHQKVLEIFDNNTKNISYAYNSFSPRSSGEIEFCMLIDKTNQNYCGISIQDENGNNALDLVQFSNEFYVQHGNENSRTGLKWNKNVWHKIHLSFDAGIVEVKINGYLYGSYPMKNSITNIGRFRAGTNNLGSNLNLYLTSVNYSWVSDYQPNQLSELANSYNGVYSFQDETPGTIPHGWMASEPVDTKIQVIADYMKHSQVLGVYDGSINNTAEAVQDFSAQTQGTIEFWTLITAPNQNYLSVGIWNDATPAGLVQIVSNTFIIVSEYWVLDTGLKCNIDVWYHIRFTFADGGFSVDINGKNYIQEVSMSNNLTAISRFRVGTARAASNVSIMVDGLDYSWVPDYISGRNEFKTTDLIQNPKILKIIKWTSIIFVLSLISFIGFKRVKRHFMYRSLNGEPIISKFLPQTPKDGRRIINELQSLTERALKAQDYDRALELVDAIDGIYVELIKLYEELGISSELSAIISEQEKNRGQKDEIKLLKLTKEYNQLTKNNDGQKAQQISEFTEKVVRVIKNLKSRCDFAKENGDQSEIDRLMLLIQKYTQLLKIEENTKVKTE